MNLKKIFQGLAIGAAFMLPFTASAMSPVSDSELSGVTGQAGVSINLDVAIDVKADSIAWGDVDGLGTTAAPGTGGWVGLSGLDVQGVRIRLRKDISDSIDGYKTTILGVLGGANGTAITAIMIGAGGNNPPRLSDLSNPDVQAALQAQVGDATIGADVTSMLTAASQMNPLLASLRPLTIDVATGTKETVANTTYVRIGLGTLEIGVNSVNAKVGLSPYAAGAAPNLAQELGSLYIGNMMVRLGAGADNSYVDIYKDPLASQGVALGLYLNVASLTIQDLSWGDNDGAPAVFNGVKYGGATSTTAGYVGLADLSIASLIVDGAVKINVGTSAVPTTYVQIALANLGVTIGNLEADVFVNSAPQHAMTAGVNDTGKILGHIYVGNLSTLTLNGDVKISAPAGAMGVNIDLNVAVSQLSLGVLSWGDSDGLLVPAQATNAAGYVGLKSLTIGGAAGLVIGGQVNINVATDATTDHGFENATFVRIGLDGLSIALDTMSGTVALGSAQNTLSQELGSFQLTGIQNVVIDGTVDISAETATAQGVAIRTNLNIASFGMDALSWGDSDGFTGAANPGYVGLIDLAITDLSVAGLVTIDIATIRPTAVDNYAFYAVAGMSTTFVHLGLGNGNAGDPDVVNTTSSIVGNTFSAGTLGIRVASLGATVALSNAAALTSPASLGLLDIQNLRVGVNGFVDIAAH